jgi:hypothetical protein
MRLHLHNVNVSISVALLRRLLWRMRVTQWRVCQNDHNITVRKVVVLVRDEGGEPDR